MPDDVWARVLAASGQEAKLDYGGQVFLRRRRHTRVKIRHIGTNGLLHAEVAAAS
jgi:hypothetical protein